MLSCSTYPTGREGEVLDFDRLLEQVSTLRITVHGLIMELKTVPGPAAPKVAVDGITAKVLEGAADWGATVAELFKKEEKRLDDSTIQVVYGSRVLRSCQPLSLTDANCMSCSYGGNFQPCNLAPARRCANIELIVEHYGTC